MKKGLTGLHDWIGFGINSMTVHTEFPLRDVPFTCFEGYELSRALIFNKSNLIKHPFPEIC